jgi:hypothetical protein
LCFACPSFPTAAETPIPSVTVDDLDVVDSAFVVTALSQGRDSPDDGAAV